MGQSSGAGSPVYFACPVERRQRTRAWNARAHTYSYTVPHHEVVRTGRQRPYNPPRGSARGTRSMDISVEYRCLECGHMGWTNHYAVMAYPGEVGD